MNNRVERSVSDLENEIVHQILISETCFNICKSISELEKSERGGRGSDFVPFYYNLNFSKAIISLHSLLASNSPDELTIKNYLKRYKENFPSKQLDNFEAEIIFVSELFKNALPISLRHKVFAHIDSGFKHSDFTCAYTLPESLDKYISVVQNLKNYFFKFCNWSLNNSHDKILAQSESIIKKTLEDSSPKYQL